ncbi:MAG: formylglycine-generating enzyme family protein [Rhodospirillaceae bacterium]|nr:formylglycine-generating enzyme family protein [Rhodospirillaceae bacterium]
MVVIPSGSFLMGSLASEVNHEPDESPQRRVTFAKLFAVSSREVTRGQYAEFVRATGRKSGPDCSVWAGTKWDKQVGRDWTSPNFAQTDAHPVVCVDWADAKAYAAWLGQITGKPYRLITEAEWEYAARGGTTTPYFFGANQDDLCATDNGRDQTSVETHPGMAWPGVKCRDGYAETAPVGSFKPNPFGLYDVHGNVWEWMEDCYAENYAGAPTDGSAVSASDCVFRVYRGGGWSVEYRGRRSANRGKYAPDQRYGQLGTRVARDLP